MTQLDRDLLELTDSGEDEKKAKEMEIWYTTRDHNESPDVVELSKHFIEAYEESLPNQSHNRELRRKERVTMRRRQRQCELNRLNKEQGDIERRFLFQELEKKCEEQRDSSPPESSSSSSSSSSTDSSPSGPESSTGKQGRDHNIEIIVLDDTSDESEASLSPIPLTEENSPELVVSRDNFMRVQSRPVNSSSANDDFQSISPDDLKISFTRRVPDTADQSIAASSNHTTTTENYRVGKSNYDIDKKIERCGKQLEKLAGQINGFVYTLNNLLEAINVNSLLSSRIPADRI
ncbi:hypothetical protein ACHAQJ_002026 [Trichoderma viride]